MDKDNKINNKVIENKNNIPSKLSILPLQDTVIFPFMVIPLHIEDESSIKLINDSLVGEKIIGLFCKKGEGKEKNDIYSIGTAAGILKMLRMPDNTIRLIAQGLSRITIKEFINTQPYTTAKIEVLEEVVKESKELEGIIRQVQNQFQKFITLAPNLPEDVKITVLNIEGPGKLGDFIASILNISAKEKQEILEELNVLSRLKKVLIALQKEIEILELGNKIQSQIKGEIDKAQREYFLREQLKAIQKELGEGDERSVEINEFKKKIEEAKMPKEAEEAANKELDRLSKMHPSSAEYTVSRTYLDWLTSMPWSISTEDNWDIKKAETVLNEDHYNLEKVKQRILEFLAVIQLKKGSMKGPILCFVGPPGVGKTSLGQSIARALGRKFIRMSLGGIRDEAEIRGHRRTYIGSLPGRIIQGLKKAGTNNPVFMLDEIDKIGTDFRGDPSAALLEVLDPEQNNSFTDHYLDVPFDLSKVMFITTANVLHPIIPALKDRMEVIELTGYMDIEKVKIAKTYLIPRALEENGLPPSKLIFPEKVLMKIINGYTKEAGVRNLYREISNICRKIAKEHLEGNTKNIELTEKMVKKYLGPEKFYKEIAEMTGQVGVSTGLAWTEHGGEILFVESTIMPGGKNLKLTGQLGEVMKESAEASLSIVRSQCKKLNIKEDFFNNHDIHIHVPAGAIPKDGPSAGVTIVTSLVSLLSNKKVSPNVAMTGEITLRGKVLPVGGIKEKILAAHRAGIKKVIIPLKNKNDLIDVPAEIKKSMKFIFAENINDVLENAFTNKL